MSVEPIAQLAALAGLLVAVVGLAVRWQEAARRATPIDRAEARGTPARGLVYVFTAGMAPWAKESTRIHSLAYLRGVGFHLGIGLGLVVLCTAPMWRSMPAWPRGLVAAALATAAVLGAAGSVMRRVEPNLRALTTPDDYASIWVVSLFLAASAASLLHAALAPVMYLAAGVMLAYIPFGKIRHCVFFFAAKGTFGRFVGRRGVLPHPGAPARPGPAGEGVG